MFINISNHPSSKWTEEQKRVANACGSQRKYFPDDGGHKIVDVPFPRIDPGYSSQDIINLVEKFIDGPLAEHKRIVCYT